jgi:hypothetical protein
MNGPVSVADETISPLSDDAAVSLQSPTDQAGHASKRGDLSRGNDAPLRRQRDFRRRAEARNTPTAAAPDEEQTVIVWFGR